MSRFSKFAWFAVLYNVAVILWGAFVRATGSGAGCGSHWPLCNGEIIPRSTQIETIIEFMHRITSGLSLVIVLLLLVLAFRLYPPWHRVRLSAVCSIVFIITEALVGAGLVLFRWVAQDASNGRVISMALHLVNTFLLVASLVLTAWWSQRRDNYSFTFSAGKAVPLGLGFLGIMFLAVSGSVTALGDTLFPASSLLEGMRQDFSPTAHILLRLRIWHPILAIGVGFGLVFLVGLLGMLSEITLNKRLAAILAGVYLLQLAAGVINLLLLAPVWLQIVHLFLEVCVWITLVLFSSETLEIKEA